ncbi:MAG: sugar transferase, partial [Bacteroidota bacterium]|nr:sugar transferase [Bacteroidota bacterium]
MKNNLNHTIKYVLVDLLSASVSWLLFLYYRTVYLDQSEYFFLNKDRIISLLIINIFWVVLFALSGNYTNIYRKSRLSEIYQLFTTTLLGVTILFFAVLIDDIILNYKQYYSSFLALFC